MSESMKERILQLRMDALDIARESLDHDVRIYRGLSDVAVRLTDIIQQNGATESPTMMGAPDHIVTGNGATIEDDSALLQTIPIYRKYRGVRYQAQLDPSRIKNGREDCIYFEGEWRTPSGSAMRFTRSNTNGWTFWRYKRDNGEEAPIHEIR